MDYPCADRARCPNPAGRCGCGCGAPTRIATETRRGRVRGCPNRYLKGHHGRKSPIAFVVDEVSGCWLWQLCLTGGYGQYRHRGRMVYAHRLAYEARFGPVPEGMVVDHVCRQPACVNPDHLEAVSSAENTRRGRVAKLTPEDVAGIRELGGLAKSRELAEEYGVTRSTIHQILRGQTWRDAA